MTNVVADRDTELDKLLARIGTGRQAVSDALMARVLSDAATVQDAAKAMPARFRPAVMPRTRWSRIAAAVGGGRVLAGLGTAAVTGVVIGFAQPAPLAALTAAVWGPELDIGVDLWPDAGDLLAEG